MTKTERNIRLLVLALTGILALFLIVKVTSAQDNRAPEFDHLLRYTVQDGELAYWRVETLPVRVCQADDYGSEWNASIQRSIAEMNVAVPSVFSTDVAACDVIINIVDIVPSSCAREDGSIPAGCTEWGAPYTYPTNVYIRRDFYQLATLLHELTHAYGVWFHPERSDSVVSGYPAANWFLNSNLTQFDIDLLTYLYSQPAFTWQDQNADVSVIDRQNAEYCAWVEAHSPYSASPKLTLDAYERYRCE